MSEAFSESGLRKKYAWRGSPDPWVQPTICRPVVPRALGGTKTDSSERPSPPSPSISVAQSPSPSRPLFSFSILEIRIFEILRYTPRIRSPIENNDHTSRRRVSALTDACMMVRRQLVAVAALGAAVLLDQATNVEGCSCTAQYKSFCDYAQESAVVARVTALTR